MGLVEEGAFGARSAGYVNSRCYGSVICLKLTVNSQTIEESGQNVGDEAVNDLLNDRKAWSALDEWMNQCGWRKLFIPWRFSVKWMAGETRTISAGRTEVYEIVVEEKRKRKEILPKDVYGYSQDLDYVPDTFKNERITLLEDYCEIDCRDGGALVARWNWA